MLVVNLLIIAATVVAMEITAYLVHRYVMHGRLGWGWHRSHHEEGEGWWERNDLYGVVFAVFSAILIFAGTQGGVWPFVQIGIGFIVYGLLYYVVHDGLVHQRWPFRYVPKRGYAKRLVQAHKLHHAVDGREGCVSFGFLYAPQIAALKAQLKENASAKKRRERAETAEPLAAERS